MKALKRNKELMTEPFTKWVKDNLEFMINDGWTLIENYTPDIEEEP